MLCGIQTNIPICLFLIMQIFVISHIHCSCYVAMVATCIHTLLYLPVSKFVMFANPCIIYEYFIPLSPLFNIRIYTCFQHNMYNTVEIKQKVTALASFTFCSIHSMCITYITYICTIPQYNIEDVISSFLNKTCFCY